MVDTAVPEPTSPADGFDFAVHVPIATDVPEHVPPLHGTLHAVNVADGEPDALVNVTV